MVYVIFFIHLTIATIAAHYLYWQSIAINFTEFNLDIMWQLKSAIAIAVLLVSFCEMCKVEFRDNNKKER